MPRPMHRRRFIVQFLAGLGVAGGGAGLARAWLAGGTRPRRTTPNGDLLEAVPKGALPSFAARGGGHVQAAYRYAADHGQALRYIPCFCGCKTTGHRNNEDCYIAARHPDGRITFTSHAAG